MHEKERGHSDKDRTENEVEVDLLKGAIDEDGLVAHHLHLEVWRHAGFQFLKTLLHAVDDFHRVAAGLLTHDERDAVLVIGFRHGARLFYGVFDQGHVLQVNRLSLRIRDDELVEVLHLLHAAEGANHQLARSLVHATTGHLQILLLQCLADIIDRDIVGP